LRFGTVNAFVGYNALVDYFPTLRVLPNPDCRIKLCQQRQSEVASDATHLAKSRVADEDCSVSSSQLHEDNEWQIAVVSKSTTCDEASSSLPEGVRHAYPVAQAESAATESTSMPAASLDELRRALQSL